MIITQYQAFRQKSNKKEQERYKLVSYGTNENQENSKKTSETGEKFKKEELMLMKQNTNKKQKKIGIKKYFRKTDKIDRALASHQN